LHVGTIMRSVGNPDAAPQWQWRCGLYPGSEPGECKNGTAASFEAAAIRIRDGLARVPIETD
jgi:hypothetical protein